MEHEKYFRPGLGTESVAPFLRSFIQMVRPQRILEVGAGYTTPFLLDGLENNKMILDEGNLDMEYLEWHKKHYDPKLVILDTSVKYDLKERGFNFDSKYVEFIEGKFQGKSQKLFDTYGPFDFVWYDCGVPEDYRDFMFEYWDICSQYVIFHYTYSFQKPNPFLEIVMGHATGNPQRIDILEPHKNHQGSITILKKCSWDIRN